MADSIFHVCLVAPLPPPYGGIARWTEMITCHARRAEDIRIDVIDTAVRWRSVHDLSLSRRLIGGGCQLLRDFGRFFARLMFRRPDVIHLTTAGQFGVFRDIAFVSAAGLLRIPVIYHIRFGRVPQISAEVSREWQLMAHVMRKVHTVVTLDAATERAILCRLPNVRLRKIPNCIDVDALPPVVKENARCSQIVLYLGWVIPSKGITELLDAWTKLQPAGWRLEIAGPVDPDYQRQLLAAYHLESVVFLGELSHGEAMRELARSDIFVLPSHTEGFPNVILEAMVLGRAIVATTVGAIPEMLADGCGQLVAPRNAEELANALQLLMADERRREAMGARAQSRAVQEYSLSAVFAAYKELWQQALGSSDGKPAGANGQ